MLVAWLALMLFIPCAFGKTDSETRYAAKLPAALLAVRRLSGTRCEWKRRDRVPFSQLTSTQKRSCS